MILAIILFIAVLALIVIIKARSTSVLQVSNSDLDTVEECYNINNNERSDCMQNTPIKHTGFAITGLVLGLCSIVLFVIGVIPLLAIIFSGISIHKSKKQNIESDSFAVAGLTLGIIFTIINTIYYLIIFRDFFSSITSPITFFNKLYTKTDVPICSVPNGTSVFILFFF